MTFQSGVWAVDGNQVPAGLARLQLQGATIGSQGVVGHLDCRVTANSPATSGIIISDGAVLILGQETDHQGTYWGFNLGNDTTLTIAATGGSPRSDMIVTRAEDPTWSGTPWGGPASGQIVFPRVISGVSSTATVAPAGMSAIPLARIDMPASTSVVQSSFIKDLRFVANPQRIMQMQSMQGAFVSGLTTTSATTPKNWPDGAAWSIFIPSWATQIVTSWSVNEAQLQLGSTGNVGVKSWVWTVIGSISSPVVIMPQSFIQLTATDGNNTRHTIGGGSTVPIPASIRGTFQTIQFAQQSQATGWSGQMAVDPGSGVTLIYEFQQLATGS